MAMMEKTTVFASESVAEGLERVVNECAARGWDFPFTVVGIGPKNTIIVRRYHASGRSEKLLEQLPKQGLATVGTALVVD
jgi:hypothetical protein